MIGKIKSMKLSVNHRGILFFLIVVSRLTKAGAQAELQSTTPGTTMQLTGVQSSIDYRPNSRFFCKYFGNSFSNKFHRPSCLFAKAISRRNLVLFQSRQQAIAAHFTPCRYCLPPVWLSVHGTIMSSDRHIKLFDQPANIKIGATKN